MKLLALLTIIRDILFYIRDLSEKVAKAAKKAVFKKAIVKAEEGDQRDVEEALSGNSGNPTKHKYVGLHTRPAKKRRGDMVD